MQGAVIPIVPGFRFEPQKAALKLFNIFRKQYRKLTWFDHTAITGSLNRRSDNKRLSHSNSSSKSSLSNPLASASLRSSSYEGRGFVMLSNAMAQSH